ncbi:membrane lipoprotein lipid attachment site-containing protein [Enterococcus malodoratus]|uniref:membrane lipoprotein lipid attachment site-containing protein n=1 Tax=Enterococcus malodoratus TaxID=71451 RepID=UPI0022E4B9AD|nr:membrane lipoprotein lipid attachment site-containing protein [Enterococcus malodoratus]
MKKYLLLFSALFVLSACNSGNNDSKDSTTKSTAAATAKTSTSTSKKIAQLVVQVQIRILHQTLRHKQVHQKQIHPTAIMQCRQWRNCKPTIQTISFRIRPLSVEENKLVSSLLKNREH